MSRCPDCECRDCICDEISPEGVRRRVRALETRADDLEERLAQLEENAKQHRAREQEASNRG